MLRSKYLEGVRGFYLVSVGNSLQYTSAIGQNKPRHGRFDGVLVICHCEERSNLLFDGARSSQLQDFHFNPSRSRDPTAPICRHR